MHGHSPLKFPLVGAPWPRRPVLPSSTASFFGVTKFPSFSLDTGGTVWSLVLAILKLVSSIAYETSLRAKRHPTVSLKTKIAPCTRATPQRVSAQRLLVAIRQ